MYNATHGHQPQLTMNIDEEVNTIDILLAAIELPALTANITQIRA